MCEYSINIMKDVLKVINWNDFMERTYGYDNNNEFELTEIDIIEALMKTGKLQESDIDYLLNSLLTSGRMKMSDISKDNRKRRQYIHGMKYCKKLCNEEDCKNFYNNMQLLTEDTMKKDSSYMFKDLYEDYYEQGMASETYKSYLKQNNLSHIPPNEILNSYSGVF